jgi:hypothetical protein
MFRPIYSDIDLQVVHTTWRNASTQQDLGSLVGGKIARWLDIFYFESLPGKVERRESWVDCQRAG